MNGLGHIAEIAPGEKSQFDVLADGTLLFSKQERGRWPEPREVALALAET